jgi:hypothetical protein
VSWGKDRTLNQNIGTLPNVSGAIMGQLRMMAFGVVRKTVNQTTFDTQEEVSNIRAKAQLQPYKPTELEIAAIGSRSWQWKILRALPILILRTDDVVKIDDQPYRVMSVFPWQEFGFVEYKLVEDYKGLGP